MPMDERRRPGRPATGQTPNRSVRIGSAWDRARAEAERRGETIATVIEHALEEYAVENTEIPPLSDGTRAAIANLVEYTIAREYGQDASGLTGARMLARAGLEFDLREDYLSRTDGDEHGLTGLADTTLRILVRDGLAARLCQCAQLHPGGCAHGPSTVVWCPGHYESDVPPIGGALLCGTCHGAEYSAHQS